MRLTPALQAGPDLLSFTKGVMIGSLIVTQHALGKERVFGQGWFRETANLQVLQKMLLQEGEQQHNGCLFRTIERNQASWLQSSRQVGDFSQTQNTMTEMHRPTPGCRFAVRDGADRISNPGFYTRDGSALLPVPSPVPYWLE